MANDDLHRVLSRVSYNQRVLAAEERKRRLEEAGICGCGHPVEKCRPEACSHKFAHAAIWGHD